MDDAWDAMIRDALLEAGREDYREALDLLAAAGPPRFSARYLRWRERFLQDPFVYAKKHRRSPLRRVLHSAACLLATLGLSTALVLATNPAARAWAVRLISTWHSEYTEYEFHGSGEEVGDLGVWRPTYIPEGYALWDESINADMGSISYANKDNSLLSITYMPLSESSFFSLDNEHSDFSHTTIDGMEVDLYTANTPGSLSTVVLADEKEHIVFIVAGVLDTDDLIHIAESIERLPQ